MESRLSPGCSYGKVLRRFQVDGFTLSETDYPSHFKAPRHSHQQAFFYTVLDGAYTEVFGRTTLSAAHNSLIYHPAEETHTHHTHHTGARCFNVDIGPHWLERTRACSVATDTSAELRGGLLVSLTARLYRKWGAGVECPGLDAWGGRTPARSLFVLVTSLARFSGLAHIVRVGW